MLTQASLQTSIFCRSSVFPKSGALARMSHDTLPLMNRHLVMCLGIDRQRQPGPPESPFGRELE